MNKTEFIKALSEKAGLKVKEADAFYGALLQVTEETLKKGEKIQLTGFATIELKEKAEREGINPATKAKITIPASKAPAVKFGKAYKELFN
ncbi:MAG: HU family DNA-binding protein [Bacillota bacterium]